MTRDNLIVQRITNPVDIQDTHLDMKEGGSREATAPVSRTAGSGAPPEGTGPP